MLEIRGLEHSAGGRCVLSISGWSLARGDRLAIVGPNGSGKSTLLRLMAFLEAPTRGEITFDGHSVRSGRERRAARRRVTLVEQRPFLFRGSVLDNVAWGLRARGMARADARRRAAESLAELGSAALEGRDARSLSEGEVQRVAVARALAVGAEVVLLDEPVSGADRAAQAALYHAIEMARTARNTTVCVASHQLEEAYRWADRVLALHNGQPVPVTPENLFRVELPGPGPMQSVVVSGVTIDVVSDRTGMVTLAIPPDEIVLSRAPLDSSARNEVQGRIVRVSEQGGAMRVTIDGGIELVALITRRSFEDMGLSVGAGVVGSFKSVAVRIF